MNTQLATRQFRIKQWSEIIHARIESGQTIKEWCKQNNVSEKSYYYWLNKLKTVAVEEADSSFFEVPAMQASSRTDHDNTFSPELTISIGSAVIGVDRNTPEGLLERVLSIVHHA